MDLKAEIKRLAKERDAVILAHNYQPDEIQEIADIAGDSLGLSIEAAKTTNKVIVFCGVHFMAETASMLAPEKTVLLPRMDAGCPMADMITGEKLAEFKAQHPGAVTVCYVNSTAEVKAQSDLCCTSGNAVNVIKSIQADRILFVPDKNLGHYVQRFTDKEIILYPGFCPIHNRVTVPEIQQLKREHPDAVVVAHPECPPSVVDIADHVCSTSGIYSYCKESPAQKFIIATETGVGYRLRLENPEKTFLFAYEGFTCKNMKKTSLQDVYDCLLNMGNVVKVDAETARKAVTCIEKMLAIPRNA
ncbi:quinolinate synthase NadA [Seleniivibrio woodruffii]|uniref:Quinolinate synthase n=1 Tax=Seleniivibrio woodruffii TaxID=1078050 RepID=A0A4V2PSG0_9BACT|nr:quinolinate synthase NadA [Seleniivibrio woodruffii]TCK62571.1 quinolinate synthetase [Seleniivibrio woodruffii]TVZ37003.1 quinolinate synthetase [Seleniivibrio woodruffii]